MLFDVLKPPSYGMPVARDRLYMVSWPEGSLVDAGVDEAFLRTTFTKILDAIADDHPLMDPQTFLLPEAHPVIVEARLKGLDAIDKGRQLPKRRKSDPDTPEVWVQRTQDKFRRQGRSSCSTKWENDSNMKIRYPEYFP